MSSNENENKVCTECVGVGEVDTDRNQLGTGETCTVCAGTGWVNPKHICCCGRAAVFFEDEALFCGREACLKAIKSKAQFYGLA